MTVGETDDFIAQGGMIRLRIVDDKVRFDINNSAAKNAGLPEDLLNRLQWAVPAIPLTGFPSFATAFANDVDPMLIFAQLVFGLGKPGDVLVGVSTSGNSQNVCQAARVR